jgi:hypothetical protein
MSVARDALLALLAGVAVGAALDQVESVQNAGVGVAVDAEFRRGLKVVLAAVAREVGARLERLVIKLFDEGAFLIIARLPHEVGGGAGQLGLPRGRAVHATRI